MKKNSSLLSLYLLLIFATFSHIPALSIELPKKMSAATRAALSSPGKGLSRSDSPYLSLIMMIDDDSVVDDLINMGVIVYNRRDNLLLTSVPRENLQEALNLDGIIYIQSSCSPSTSLDKARSFCDVEAAHNGFSLPQNYTGTGVVTGISDIGFDAQHIAFRNAVSEIHAYYPEDGIVKSTITPEEVKAWTTDTKEEYHASHVANILGGRCFDSPYFGVATGSDMVITTSTLTDVGILAGVESIIKYAKKQNKPAVINLSLGAYTGPHDGTDLMSQYLSSCAQDAVICIAAGNYGNKNIGASWRFTSQDSIARVEVLDSKTWTGLEMNGMTDVWSNNSKPLPVRFEIYDHDQKELIYYTDWCECTEEDLGVLFLDSNKDENLGKYFEGKIYLYAGIDELNGRFNASFYYEYKTEEESVEGPWSKYRLGLAVKGEEGTELQFYADGSYTILCKVAGLDTCIPSSSQSINNMCCADGVISVGSCNSRNTTPVLDSDDHTWNFQEDRVSQFTAYGSHYDGTPLPHFCAPGNYLVSALSSDYLLDNPSMDVAAKTEIDGNDYYWKASCGTSMASPMAAGIIALWLEADPTLTSAEILDIAKQTCKTDYPDINDPRWGYGCIDAFAGLKQIIQNADSFSPTIKPIVNINPDGSLDIAAPADASIMMFDAFGHKINPYSPHSPGVYILVIEGCSPIKILVK